MDSDVIDELNGSMTVSSDKSDGEDGEILKLEADDGKDDNLVERGVEDSNLIKDEVPKSNVPLMAFLMGVWAMLKRGYERLLETDWLSWLPFWPQEKRLERLIAEADANPKDAAKQSALLAELNKHRLGISFPFYISSISIAQELKCIGPRLCSNPSLDHAWELRAHFWCRFFSWKYLNS